MPKATGYLGRNDIRNGEIITEHIADGAITAAKIADGAIVATEIADNAITTTKILDSNVTTAKIANSAVTLAKLNGNIIKEDNIALTNAEFLNLRATPKTLVAAGGAGTMHIVIGALLESLASGGAYTESADNLAVKYTDGSGASASGTIETTGVIDSTSQTYSYAPGAAVVPVVNAALVLHNTGDGEFGGGDAANVMRLKIRYYTLTL